MNNNDYFAINLEFCSETIYNKVLELWHLAHLENGDKHITKEQIKSLILENCKKKIDGEFLLSASILKDIINQAFEIICGSSLSIMASQGKIECYWDDEQNNMVFTKKK